jgi:hypothetical protein
MAEESRCAQQQSRAAHVSCGSKARQPGPRGAIICGLVQCNNDRLFDQLVRSDEQDRRDFEIERPGGPQVDYQIEPGRLHDG